LNPLNLIKLKIVIPEKIRITFFFKGVLLLNSIIPHSFSSSPSVRGDEDESGNRSFDDTTTNQQSKPFLFDRYNSPLSATRGPVVLEAFTFY